MRNIPGYPADTASLEPITRVMHGGQERKIYGLSLARDLPSSLHAQVAGLGGIEPAEGGVSWAALTDVIESYPTAFTRQGNWPPRTRDHVNVEFGYRTDGGDLLAKALTGLIEDGRGDAQEGHDSGLVDPIARLSQRVNLPPLHATMPPLTSTGPFRYIGLYPTYFTDVAARAAGFFSTPPMSAGCVVSAPLMGSAWPERGTVTVSTRASSSLPLGPLWLSTPWGGLGACDAAISYTPVGDSRLNRPMEVTSMAQVASGGAQVTVRWEGLSLIVSRNALGVSALLGGGGQVCRLDTTTRGPVTMRVVPSGGTLNITIRDDTGTEASGSVAGSATGNMTVVNISSSATAAVIGGIQVAFPSTPWTALGYTRSAFIGRAAHNVSLVASPPIQDQTAYSLLDDQARAELAAVWIDEDGYLQWRNRNDLVAGAPVTKLTTASHVHNLPWEEDFTGVSSKVEVTARQPLTTSNSRYPSLEIWSSNYSAMDANGLDDLLEELLHPDADTDWLMVDTTFDNTNAESNRGRGSDAAVYFFFTNGLRPTEGGYSAAEGYERSWVRASLEFVDHRTYKLTTQVLSVPRSGYNEYEFSLKIPTEKQSPIGGGWGANLGGTNFPVVRAQGTTNWNDTTFRANAGVWDAPVLTHDVSWFVQATSAVQEIANLLAAATTTPRPFLSEVSIVPDPRLQRADIITISDPGITGVEFRCLITGIKDNISPGEWSQSLTVQLLSTTIL